MSTSTNSSIESAEFDFCSPNYLNDLVENIVDQDMPDDSEPQQIRFQKDRTPDKIVNKNPTNIESVVSDEVNIPANQQPAINTALNITTNDIGQHAKTRNFRKKYVYHLPKAISKNDIYKYKNSHKYRNILPAGKSNTIYGFNTNISNIRKPVTIEQLKQNVVHSPKKTISNYPIENGNTQIYSSTLKDLMVTSQSEDINKEETNACKNVDTIQEKSEKYEIENVCNDRIKKKHNIDLTQIINNDSAKLRTIGSDDGIWDVDKTYSKEATMIQSFNSNEKQVMSLNPQAMAVVRTPPGHCTEKDGEEKQNVDLENKIDKSTGNCAQPSPDNTKRIPNIAKLAEVMNKLNELQAKIPKITGKFIDIPITMDESELESRYILARKDLHPNSVVLNTSDNFNHEKPSDSNIVERERQYLPLDLSKHVADISENHLCPTESTHLNLVTETNNSQHDDEQELNKASGTSTAMMAKKLYDAKFVQTENIPISNINTNNELNITNTHAASMEITKGADISTNMRKNVSVMVNMSLEKQNCDKTANDEKLSDNNKKTEMGTENSSSANITKKPEPKHNSITEVIREKEDMADYSKKNKDGDIGEMKKVIESIVLDVLETLPELENWKKQYYKDSIDYIIEEVINRYSETKISPKRPTKRKSLVRNKTCEVKAVKVMEKKSSNNKGRIQKRVSKKKTTKKPETTAMKVTNIKKTTPSNKIYESIEQLTQTIRTTLDEFGKLHDSQNSILKELKVNKDKSSSELFNTNLSNLSYKFTATSTPLESEHGAAKCLRGLNIMQKKIEEIKKTQCKVSANSTETNVLKRIIKEKAEVAVTDVAQKGKCTKQSTLTQTYNLQKNTQTNSLCSKRKDNCSPQKEVLNTNPPQRVLNNTPPDNDHLFIEMDLSDDENINNCSNMNSLTNILKKVEQWKNDSCPWIGGIEYDEPRIFDPNYLIMFDNSQASTTQFPSNQEALRQKR